jgi:hypothetical protein
MTDNNEVIALLREKIRRGAYREAAEYVASFPPAIRHAIYHCKVQGGGAGTRLARWDFRENPDRRDGIGQEQILTLTLPVTGEVSGSVIVSARLARPGLQGSLDAIRDLVLGESTQERFYPLRFSIPTVSSARGLAKFFRFL